MICSVLLLLLGMVQDLPLVLCFDPGGQVELEAETANGVCADWEADRRPAGELKGQFRHCVDVPLSHLSQGQAIYKAVAFANPSWFGGWVLHQVVHFAQSVAGWRVPLQNQIQWANPPPLLRLGAVVFLKTIILLL